MVFFRNVTKIGTDENKAFDFNFAYELCSTTYLCLVN